jgi:hypothetical protein
MHPRHLPGNHGSSRRNARLARLEELIELKVAIANLEALHADHGPVGVSASVIPASFPVSGRQRPKPVDLRITVTDLDALRVANRDGVLTGLRSCFIN